MDQQIKEQWVSALRGGEYRQGKRALLDAGRYCCLGVLCAVQEADLSDRAQFPSMYISQVPAQFAAGLPEARQGYLAGMNDGGDSFDEIADYIEEYC